MIQLPNKKRFTVDELAKIILKYEDKLTDKKRYKSLITSIYRTLKEKEDEYPTEKTIGSSTWIPYDTAIKVINPPKKQFKKILRTAIIHGKNDYPYVINLDIISAGINPIIADNQYIWNYKPCNLCEHENEEQYCSGCNSNNTSSGFTMFQLANCYTVSKQRELGNYK